MRMKLILYVFFGLIAGTATVCGQAPAISGGFQLGRQLRADSLFRRMMPRPGQTMPRTDHMMPGPGRVLVRMMQPDRMPCVVADIGRVERMPVRRMESPDPMPNGVRVPESEPPPFQERP
jgi:hypothetical protein